MCDAGLTPFLVKLLSEDELTTKQALHLIDLQLKEQVSFQDLHELYMLDYTTAIPSPHLKTCQLLVGLNTATRLVQILKGTSGSGMQCAAVLQQLAACCPCLNYANAAVSLRHLGFAFCSLVRGFLRL